jgi:hypothetical protein
MSRVGLGVELYPTNQPTTDDDGQRRTDGNHRIPLDTDGYHFLSLAYEG